jgi:hypothetical protein
MSARLLSSLALLVVCALAPAAEPSIDPLPVPRALPTVPMVPPPPVAAFYRANPLWGTVQPLYWRTGVMGTPYRSAN